MLETFVWPLLALVTIGIWITFASFTPPHQEILMHFQLSLSLHFNHAAFIWLSQCWSQPLFTESYGSSIFVTQTKIESIETVAVNAKHRGPSSWWLPRYNSINTGALLSISMPHSLIRSGSRRGQHQLGQMRQFRCWVLYYCTRTSKASLKSAEAGIKIAQRS